MDYLKVKERLINKSHSEERVGVFISYLRQLSVEKDKDGKIKAWWYRQNMTDEKAVDLYCKVAIDGLYIDGETITLGFRKKILITYNFQAYKNRVLMKYPESKFDLQVVYDSETFSFNKKNGSVFYTHEMLDPFAENKVIIGVYCIISNDRGEFIELLNKTEIDKMKAVSTMKNIWRDWESEMWKKSVVKRSCKTHFFDITKNMDSLDNEQYDFDNLDTPESIYEQIKKFENKDELLGWASSKVNIPYQNDKEFRSAVSEQLAILEQDKDYPQTKQ